MGLIGNESEEILSQLVFKMWYFLLANVFEKLRNISLKHYGLCLSHYLRVRVLGWDATLNMTKF